MTDIFDSFKVKYFVLFRTAPRPSSHFHDNFSHGITLPLETIAHYPFFHIWIQSPANQVGALFLSFGKFSMNTCKSVWRTYPTILDYILRLLVLSCIPNLDYEPILGRDGRIQDHA